jgi:hypothetical protein
MAQRSNLNAEIAARVRDAAQAAGVSETALAEQAGIAVRTFRRHMAGGRWVMDDIEALADVLDVDPALLAFGAVA